VPIPALLELGDIPNDPSQNRRVRDLDTTLRHHRDEISIAQPVGDVPADAKLDDVSIEGAAAVNGVTSNRLRVPLSGGRIAACIPRLQRRLKTLAEVSVRPNSSQSTHRYACPRAAVRAYRRRIDQTDRTAGGPKAQFSRCALTNAPLRVPLWHGRNN
jgi:hypothetical protein